MPLSGFAFSENSIRKASPTETIIGALTSNETFSAANAVMPTRSITSVRTVFLKIFFIVNYSLAN